MKDNSRLVLKAKKDYNNFFINIIEPVEKYFSNSKALLKLPTYTATTYDDKTLDFESFARILWGAGPYLNSVKDDRLINIFSTGIINGTNPNNLDYWGDIKDYDQKMVEMVPISLFLYFTKSTTWDTFSSTDKINIQNWLLQCNNRKTVNNNWLFFRVIVNICLKQIGANYSSDAINKNLVKIDKFYLGNGWYSDGDTDKRDYYTSFAFHYYSLIYAKLANKDDKLRSDLFKERAKIFAKDYIYWFSEDGSTIPFGRSLTYRFAQSSFWAALIFADVDVFSLGVLKGLISRNLKWWAEQSIFNETGLLTIGYSYPNLLMSEVYNGSGSSYWSLKTFLILCIDDDHEFWKAEEEKIPLLKKQKFQPQSRMIICRDNSHIVSFVNGQNGGDLVSKYEKFAYSNKFGFSISRSNIGLKNGAYDSTLAISHDGETYKPRHNLSYFNNNNDLLYSEWSPSNDVKIKTYIVPGIPWHVRVHKITTESTIYLQDGGFAVERESHNYNPPKRNVLKIKNGVAINYGSIHSGIVSLIGEGLPEIIFPSPNTNILFSRSELPILTWKLRKGNYLIVNAILGDFNEVRNPSNFYTDLPKISIEGEILQVSLNNQVFSINLEKKHKIPNGFYRKLKLIKKQLKQGYKFIRN